MYPFIRSYLRSSKARRSVRLDPWATTSTMLRVTPFDIDPCMELNNGRTLTLYDLARVPHYIRIGLMGQVDEAGLYITVAGASVRYRGRIRPFAKVEIRTRMRGWDRRFLYTEQSIWQGEECANNVLIRQAIARRGQGIVSPSEVVVKIGLEPESPPLPEWITNWIDAEGTRIWPPEMEGV